MPALAVTLEHLLENRRIRQKQLLGRVREERQTSDPFHGVSAAIRQLKTQPHKVLATTPSSSRARPAPAKACSPPGCTRTVRAPKRLSSIDLNCAGLSREFLETELFGHEKGAFTGAVSSKQGLLEVAQRGTVFLDEIGDVDPLVQPKLLKVLEDKRFRRLGDVRDRRIDVPLIAATHQDLHRFVRENRFRSNLYFRISTIPLRVPGCA